MSLQLLNLTAGELKALASSLTDLGQLDTPLSIVANNNEIKVLTPIPGAEKESMQLIIFIKRLGTPGAGN